MIAEMKDKFKDEFAALTCRLSSGTVLSRHTSLVTKEKKWLTIIGIEM
jgi:hypothetical protein